MKKFLMLSCVLSILTSCSSKPNTPQPAKKINPEILGSWNDDNGCKMSIDLNGDQLIMKVFDNSRGVAYTNIPMQWSKQSVFTVFKPIDTSVNFSGSFSDGFITIDNGVCNKILHKDGTK